MTPNEMFFILGMLAGGCLVVSLFTVYAVFLLARDTDREDALRGKE